MAKYISNRQQNLKIGIVSYTENETVLEVTGGTYISGSVGIGSTTPTSKLTVVGDVLVSGVLTASSIVGTSLSISGISTIANFLMTPVGTGATVGGIGVTYYGDGLNLTGIVTSIVAGTNITISPSGTGQVTINSNSSGGGSISISTNTANQSQYITYVAGTGTTTGLGVTTDGLVFNPFSGNLGIGTATPTSKLTVQGDVLVSGILTAAHIVGTSLSISGISTIGNFLMTPVGTGATVGGIGVTYYGDGSNLDGVVGGLGGIGTAGGTVGTGITFLDFRGSGISSVTASAGIATITIPGASRSVTPYTAEEGETSFAATYSVGYADVYLNGSKLSDTEYTASNGTSIELTEGASLGDIVEIVSYIINITGASAGGTKTYTVFTPNQNQPPATDFATLDTRNSILVLDFDDATDESAVFVGVIPEAASLGSGLKIRLQWAATTATSGDCVWDVSLERMTTVLDSDSFDTIASATAAANGTSGILTVTEITLTTIDSVTAGDGYRLKVTRKGTSASDTMSGDAELVVVEVRSAA